MQAQSRVINDEQGRPVGMRGMDITARKMLDRSATFRIALPFVPVMTALQADPLDPAAGLPAHFE